MNASRDFRRGEHLFPRQRPDRFRKSAEPGKTDELAAPRVQPSLPGTAARASQTRAPDAAHLGHKQFPARRPPRTDSRFCRSRREEALIAAFDGSSDTEKPALRYRHPPPAALKATSPRGIHSAGARWRPRRPCAVFRCPNSVLRRRCGRRRCRAGRPRSAVRQSRSSTG